MALVGGVAANKELRRVLMEATDREGIRLVIPPFSLCTDNAAMIASAARYVTPRPLPSYLHLDVYASGEPALS